MIQSFTTLLVALVFMVSTGAFAQDQLKPPVCSADYDATQGDSTPKKGLASCAGVAPGALGWVTDGLDPSDCTTGTGTSQGLCMSEGDGTFTSVQLNTGPTVTAVVAADTAAIDGTILMDGCFNNIYTNTGATGGTDITLPDITAANIGMCLTFTATAAQVMCFEQAATDQLALGIETGGVLTTAGDSIDSPGAVGNTITLMATALNVWSTLASAGVWADGGTACP